MIVFRKFLNFYFMAEDISFSFNCGLKKVRFRVLSNDVEDYLKDFSAQYFDPFL
jgi:hypothetical protein